MGLGGAAVFTVRRTFQLNREEIRQRAQSRIFGIERQIKNEGKCESLAALKDRLSWSPGFGRVDSINRKTRCLQPGLQRLVRVAKSYAASRTF